MSTFYELPEVGSRLTLVTHLVVREDAHLLYGFLSESERVLFRELIKVSGIGARIALGVLSSMSVRGFHQCIRNKDLVSLVRIPGVGKKTGERLIVEMAGTGLGLALVREIVTAHGGEVTVHSQPGVGSEFSFSLPLSLSAKCPPAEDEPGDGDG